jgi:hypothetical protein
MHRSRCEAGFFVLRLALQIGRLVVGDSVYRGLKRITRILPCEITIRALSVFIRGDFCY